MFIAMVLGRFEPTATGLVYRVLENGCVSSFFLLIAAVFITIGDPKSFRTGIVMWVLALAALLVLPSRAILVIHLI
jgi:hypothetical protein